MARRESVRLALKTPVLLAFLLVLGGCVPGLLFALDDWSREVKARREEILGKEYVEVARLAGFYHAQGRYAEAEPLYQRALTISEKALGPDHPNTTGFERTWKQEGVATALENYAVLLRATNRADEAEELEVRAAAILAR